MKFKRLALNMDQVDKYGPPPNPTKISDSRSNGYIESYGYECWELDALEPKVITQLIEENVVKYRDEEKYQSIKLQESAEKELLFEAANHWESVSNNWEEIKERFVYGDYEE